uniref:Uncharacterized protein n=1 Tax=Meloidogyne hapla TaxID=6305 RepID=A0A1I8BCJ5_MELHA
MLKTGFINIYLTKPQNEFSKAFVRYKEMGTCFSCSDRQFEIIQEQQRQNRQILVILCEHQQTLVVIVNQLQVITNLLAPAIVGVPAVPMAVGDVPAGGGDGCAVEAVGNRLGNGPLPAAVFEENDN